MNGPVVVLLLLVASAAAFALVVLVDRWADRRREWTRWERDTAYWRDLTYAVQRARQDFDSPPNGPFTNHRVKP